MRSFITANRIAAVCLIAIVATTNAGCAGTGLGDRIRTAVTAWTSVSDATVDPKAVVVAANVALALQSTGKNYLRLRRCNGTNGPICRDPGATKEIGRAVKSMRDARNAAEDFVLNHPGQLGSQGAYDAMQAAIATVQGIYAKYHVGDATASTAVR